MCSWGAGSTQKAVVCQGFEFGSCGRHAVLLTDKERSTLGRRTGRAIPQAQATVRASFFRYRDYVPHAYYSYSTYRNYASK